MAKTLLEEIDAHTRLYMDRKTGIAWVEDSRAGVGHSVHPNISGTGSAAGMRRRGYWKKDDRIVRSHGFLYNIDACHASDEFDHVAGRACRCGGNHACVTPEPIRRVYLPQFAGEIEVQGRGHTTYWRSLDPKDRSPWAGQFILASPDFRRQIEASEAGGGRR